MLLSPEQQSFKSEKLQLDPDIVAAAAFQRVCQSCIRQFRLNEDLLLRTEGSEALHQARVAIRRLRSAFTAFRKLVAGDSRATYLKFELRWLASELGAARDIDVLLEMAKSDDVRARLGALRIQTYAQVVTVLESRRSRMLFVDLTDWLSQGGWLRLPTSEWHRNQLLRELAGQSLARLRRKVGLEGESLHDPDDDERRHDLRKDAKKLRYASEFFASQFGDPKEERKLKKFLASLEKLQDVLGRLNDLVGTADTLRSLGLDDVWQAEELADLTIRDELLVDAQRAHASLIKADRFWR